MLYSALSARYNMMLKTYSVNLTTHLAKPYPMDIRLQPSLILIILLFYSFLSAQTAFEVLYIEGSAKTQRSQKKTWENITVGTKLLDNDLVETFFQTKMIVRFGENNVAILGSNSKALLNIAAKQAESGRILNVNLTLFGGGIFVKAISGAHVSLYTANAVGEMDSGSVSTVAEGKTGETGFQVLGGSIYVRNIAQQKGKELRSGLTTMILPNKEPTAPLYITHRHVAVLKHFFGDEYITKEMDASGIKPTDERGQGNRLTLSQNMSPQNNKNADQGMYKRLFSLNRIYGSIIEDQRNGIRFYEPIPKPEYAAPTKGNIGLYGQTGFSGGVTTKFFLQPSLRFGIVDLDLRISFAQNASTAMSFGFNSVSGWLDKIKTISIGKLSDSLFLYAGDIQDYSVGYGLIVDRFSNKNPNTVFTPPGIKGQMRVFEDLDIKAFLANVTEPIIGGVYLHYEPSVYQIGAGYYFDIDQTSYTIEKENERYVHLTRTDSTVGDPSNAHIYELNFSVDVVSSYDFTMKLLLEFAQKLWYGNDGIVARVPTFICEIPGMQFGIGLIGEQGRLLSSQFSPFYLANRYRIKHSVESIDPVDTIITQNACLSANREAAGFNLFFKMNPRNGLDIDVSYKQDFVNKNTFKQTQSDSTDNSSSNISGDFSYKLICRMNDSLFPLIKYADIYAQQYHGKLFPAQGSFFLSWGFEAGFHILTKPLVFNMAVETGGKLLYIDAGKKLNTTVESSDIVFEIYAGLQWGFL